MTVTELVDLICANTSLESGTVAEDRANALRALNSALKQIVGSTLCYKKTFGPMAISGDYDLNLIDGGEYDSESFTADILAIDWLAVLEGNDLDNIKQVLDRISNRQLAMYRSTTTSANPSWYAYTDERIKFDTVPSGTFYIGGEYSAEAPDLVEDTASDALLLEVLRPTWHEHLLAYLAIALILEGSEGESERAMTFRNGYGMAMRDFRILQQRAGGSRAVSTPFELSRFSTAKPVRMRGT